MDIKFLENFKFVIVNFSLIPQDKISLPLFTGATLRGGLGYSFKKSVCLKRHLNCADCSFFLNCPYIQFFEPKMENKGGKKQEISRPFVIETSFRKNHYKENEKFQFNLILFGKCIEYFPYFFISFAELGNTGIGKFREKFYVESVFQQYPEFKKIFECGDESLEKVTEKNITIEFKDTDRIKIKFLTPARIKSDGKLVQVPEFSIFLNAILRRISQLLHFWCDYKEKIDYSEILKSAKKVKIGSCNLRWIDYKRYSTRQKTEMKLGGIKGEIEYRGNIREFYPFLKLGSYIHIGKNTTFGFGKYILLEEDTSVK